MSTALLTRRIRPLTVALLTALTLVGASVGATTSSQASHSHAKVAAMRFCGPAGNPLCPPKIKVAP